MRPASEVFGETARARYATMLTTRMVVLQPTPFCNINCDYCYLRNRRDRSVMDHATICAIADKIIANIDETTETLIVWHGGEPTMAPLEWYRSAYHILNASKRGAPLSFSVQTNGIGLNDTWANFLRDTGTSVGLSLDGPRDLHDRHRQTRNGRPTWDLTMGGLDVLRRNGIEPAIITVLTSDSLARADEMLAFYTEHRLYQLSFSVEEREGANIASSLDFPGVETAMETFLFDFIQGIARTGAPIHLRDAERILGLIATDRSNAGHNEQTEPLAAITIDWAGGIYTFSPEFSEHATGPWAHAKIGNVRTNSLADIVGSPALARLAREVREGVQACARECAFWPVCGGGSPVNRIAEHDSLAIAETQFCRLTVQATTRALRQLLY